MLKYPEKRFTIFTTFCLRFDQNGHGAHGGGGGGHSDHGESEEFDFTEILILQVTTCFMT